jgi:D-alanyl-D-alanine dipeptidase
VTKIFWDSASAEERRIEFVANPRKGSRHNRGCAVDLSLVDLKSGTEVQMPSGYDEFSKRAYPDYAGGPAEARALRDLLRAAMESEGFTVYPAEWWHFDYKDWRQYHIMDVPFEAMGK